MYKSELGWKVEIGGDIENMLNAHVFLFFFHRRRRPSPSIHVHSAQRHCVYCSVSKA